MVLEVVEEKIEKTLDGKIRMVRVLKETFEVDEKSILDTEKSLQEMKQKADEDMLKIQELKRQYYAIITGNFK